MNDEFDLTKFYNDSEAGQVTLATGEVTVGDIKEVYLIADFFASRYGMGACKTLEEYVNMIDNTDPVVLNMLKVCAIENENAKWGVDDKNKPKDSKPTTDTPPQFKTPSKTPYVPKTKAKDGTHVRSRQGMTMFLREFGVGKDDLEKTNSVLDKRKIELKDFTWVDGYELENMSHEQYVKLKKDMADERKKGVDFKVSDATIRAKYRQKGA